MHPRYFFKVMRDFKFDERYSTVMGRIAKGYLTKEMRAMGDYFASSEWLPADVPADPAQVQTGERLHDEHCAECHENGGRYQDKEVPRLAGQWPDYLLLQLEDYQTGRVEMPQPDKMRERLADLTRQDLVALSAFYAQVDEGYVANDDKAAEEPQAASETAR
jgi:sulfide dehydrogenase cytochrome subunit